MALTLLSTFKRKAEKTKFNGYIVILVPANENIYINLYLYKKISILLFSSTVPLQVYFTLSYDTSQRSTEGGKALVYQWTAIDY